MKRHAFFSFLASVLALVFGLRSAEATPPGAGPTAVRTEVLEDKTGAARAVDVASSRAFEVLRPAEGNHGYTRSTFWVRITVVNPSAAFETAILQLAATPSRAELYNAEGTELVARSGARLPFSARPVSHSNIAFRTLLAAHETRAFLIRVESNDTMILDPIVWREAAFWESVQRTRLLDGVYYGIILGLAIYNLFLSFATRERAYLAYVVFQVAMATANAAIDKYTFQFLWPNSPVWAERSEQTFNLLALAAALLCARLLLGTAALAPRLDRVLRVVALAAFVMAAVATTFDAPPAALFVIAATSFLGIAMLVVAASVVARSGSPHGRIFLVAWSVLFAAVFAAGLAAIGGLRSLAGYDFLKIGSAMEALLLSIGLAARIRTMQRDVLVERARRIDSLSRLVAGVAHEIGNPLNFAKGGAEALVSPIESIAEPGAAATARRALGLVESGLDRIARMIGHLRSDLGDRQALAVEVEVSRELDDALEMLASWLAERRILIQREPGASRHRVLARSGDLAQVFGNLVRNAGDAMPAGGTLKIEDAREGDDAVISFRDQGPGVAQELDGQVFEPFFTTRAGGAGAGLGLYVSREIVSRWGGSLTLAGSGPGAVFVVRLPLAR